MRVELKKFGTTLISRQAGSEAYKAFQPTLDDIGSDDTLEIDFSGVLTFSPSWGDEFLGPLLEKYNDRLILTNTENLSVKATIKMLEKIYQKKFQTE